MANWRSRAAAAALAVAAGVAGCGGGGSDEPAPATPPAPPPATTQTIDAGGGTLSAPLAEGAKIELAFPAGAWPKAVPVSVKPLAAAAGEWTRFQITPGTAALLEPATITLTPPASLRLGTAAAVLQVLTGGEPHLLRTVRAADGTLTAILPAFALSAAAAASGASAAAQRQRAGKAARAAADPADAEATTVVGTGLLIECRLDTTTSQRMADLIDNSPSAATIDSALNQLAMIKDSCGVGQPLDPTLADFALLAAQRHDARVAALEAIDFSDLENNLGRLVAAARPAVAWCSVLQLLNSPKECPALEAFDRAFGEMASGFSAALVSATDLNPLRRRYHQIAPVRDEAVLLDLPKASVRLTKLLGDILDLMIDRAYTDCAHGDLFDFFREAQLGLKDGPRVAKIQELLALCRTKVTVRAATQDGTDLAASRRLLLPGDADLVDAVRSVSTEVPYDGTLRLEVSGIATRCSRVIGGPVGTDQLVFKVGNKFIRALDHSDGLFAGTVSLALPALLADLARDPGNRDPFVIDIFRTRVEVSGCSDEADRPFTLVLPDYKMYSVTVRPPVARLNVRLDVPFNLTGAATVAAVATDGNGAPSFGAQVTFTVSGGSVASASGSTNDQGQFSTTLFPAGTGDVELRADVTARDGTQGTATAVLRGGAIRYTGTARIVATGRRTTQRGVPPANANAAFEDVLETTSMTLEFEVDVTLNPGTPAPTVDASTQRAVAGNHLVVSTVRQVFDPCYMLTTRENLPMPLDSNRTANNSLRFQVPSGEPRRWRLELSPSAFGFFTGGRIDRSWSAKDPIPPGTQCDPMPPPFSESFESPGSVSLVVFKTIEGAFGPTIVINETWTESTGGAGSVQTIETSGTITLNLTAR